MSEPLTFVTAGHIDHGKTALVAALTGVDTDRLVEERRRGISIELGFAPLELAGGRQISLIDVPGHERLVRTMVAGASGVGAYLLVIAADDGPMPQTREHLAVLRALGVELGAIALSKVDAVDSERRALARAEVEALAPGAPVVELSAHRREGLDELRALLGRLAAELDRRRVRLSGEAIAGTETVLHADRSFSLPGAGRIVTGTLLGGPLRPGQELLALPGRRHLRLRSAEVHDRRVTLAEPNQRVALALTGEGRTSIERGDAIVPAASRLSPCFRLDVELRLEPGEGVGDGERLQVHHGTRESPARLVELGDGFAQLRLEQELIARPQDRVVLRRIAPVATLGGAIVIDPTPRRHGPGAAVERLRLVRGGEPEELLRAALAEPGGSLPARVEAWPTSSASGLARPRFSRRRWTEALDALVDGGEAVVERGRLRAAAAEPLAGGEHGAKPAALSRLERVLMAILDRDGDEPSSPRDIAAALGIEPRLVEAGLTRLVAAGRLVRIGGDIHYEPATLERLRGHALALAADRGELTLPELRTSLGTSRKYAQALLEHLDAAKLTVRHGDRHVLRRPEG